VLVHVIRGEYCDVQISVFLSLQTLFTANWDIAKSFTLCFVLEITHMGGRIHCRGSSDNVRVRLSPLCINRGLGLEFAGCVHQLCCCLNWIMILIILSMYGYDFSGFTNCVYDLSKLVYPNSLCSDFG